MKKVYIKPITHEVVLNIQEKLMWGELANPSNDINHPGAKPFNFFKDEMTPVEEESFWEEDEDTESATTVAKRFNVWNDDL